MSQLTWIFDVHPQGIGVTRGVVVIVALLAPLVAMIAIGVQKYWLTLAFAMLFCAPSDPGGPCSRRFRSMSAVGVIGGALTALGFAIGGGPGSLVVLVALVALLQKRSVARAAPAS